MKTSRLLIVAILALISSLAGVQSVSYAGETNEVEIWFKAIKELQRMVKENDNYIARYDAKINEKKFMLEEGRSQGQPTDKLELEIGKLQRERAIRFDVGNRWKAELNRVEAKHADRIGR